MSRRKRKRNHAAGVPHLFRQRGKNRIWSALIEGQEVSLRTSDAIEANRRLHAVAEERERAARARTEAPPTLLSELGAKYIEYIQPPRMTKKSARSYQNRVLAFIEWAEKHEVTQADQVTFKLMSSYVRERSKSVSATTVNRDVVPVARMFAYGKREELLSANPFRNDDFKELKLREAERRSNATTLSPDDVAAVIRTACELLHPGHAALVAMVAGSGLRIDEARHIEPSDIKITDEEKGFIDVSAKRDWQPKSYRWRRVPVTRATCDAALEFIKHRNDVRLDDKAAWDALKRVEEHLELPHFSMHDLRRAWGSGLHSRGASLKLVSVLLGHSGVAVTERYLRIFHGEHDAHAYLAF